MKKFLCVFAFLILAFAAVFAADNMRIFSKEDGEVITGFNNTSLPEEIKITIAYPNSYKEQPAARFPLVLLFDSAEYKIEDLNKMFYFKKSKNQQAIIASFRFKEEISQEKFNSFIEDIFAFFEVNYRAEGDPSKRIVLAKNSFALAALNFIQKESNYFLNLGVILDNTTALPSFKQGLKKPVRIFAVSQRENILNLQNLFLSAGLKPLQNFFFNIKEEASFDTFDFRYFNNTPKIKNIKALLPKEILQEEAINLQVKTNYGVLDFLPTQIKFAPPVLAYNYESGTVNILLQDPCKVKISGIFEGTEWSKKVKISK